MADIIVIGDLHLGRLETIFPDKDWQSWSLAPMRQAVSYATDRGIKDIICLGDIFDIPNPPQKLLRLLADFLLLNKQINFWMLIGNHDVHSRGNNSCVFLNYLSQRKSIGNCQFFPKTRRVEIAGVPTVFLPWPKRKSPLLNERPSLVIAHVEREGARYDNGRAVKGHKFALGQHFWCIGHLHQFQAFDNLLFAGGVSQWRFGDNPDKYFLHLRVKVADAAIQVKYKKISLVPQFLLHDIVVETLDDLKQLNQLEENVYARLLIDSKIAVPDEYLLHPRVLKHRYFGDKTDLRAIRQDNFNLATAKATMQSRLAALQLWLRRRSKLPRQRRRDAVRYASRLEAKLLRDATSLRR